MPKRSWRARLKAETDSREVQYLELLIDYLFGYISVVQVGAVEVVGEIRTMVKYLRKWDSLLFLRNIGINLDKRYNDISLENEVKSRMDPSYLVVVVVNQEIQDRRSSDGASTIDCIKSHHISALSNHIIFFAIDFPHVQSNHWEASAAMWCRVCLGSPSAPLPASPASPLAGTRSGTEVGPGRRGPRQRKRRSAY